MPSCVGKGEEIAHFLAGTVSGWLPSRALGWMTGGSYRLAARMSQGNQAVCAVWGVAAVANGIAMLFGADFDPTVSNIPTYLGWYVAADTTVRSCITGMQTLKRGGMVSGPVPVGLATLEIIGSYVHDDSEPEWEA